MRAIRAKYVVLAVAGVALVTSSALAEDAAITGRFPARYRDAAMLLSLAVDRFGGRDGYQLQSAVERSVGSAGYFDMIGARSGRPEGVLSGGVSSGVEDSYYKKREKRCTVRDASNKCTREEDVEIRCTQRVANLTADLRITRVQDGAVVYSVNKPMRQQVNWCEGQSAPRTAEEMISSMIGEVAQGVRGDIIPSTENYHVRFRESTKDLPKPEVRPFKDIVKLTQRNLGAACQQWGEMNKRVPNHPSILFNLGLCAEAAGDLRAALSWYQLAAPMLGRNNEAQEGAGRVQRRMAADADDAERARRGR